MNPRSIKSLFTEFADLSPEERAAALATLDSSDPDAADQLRRLFAFDGDDDTTSALIQTFGVEALREIVDRPMLPERYEVIEKIGAGGFSTVLRCFDHGDVKREVAVKVLHRRFHDPDAPVRLERERQAMARVQHPNVAVVHDGGTTRDGRPFITMAYIAGPPIDQYADAARLTLRERVELFAPVCEAVAAVHRRALVHRDLKPSNILVESSKDGVTPKLIDFGVVKPLQEAPGADLVESEAIRIGTPAYMSPEQVRGDAARIDAAADIYGLGAVLYTLLTGRPPFTRDEHDDLYAAAQHATPRPPSERLAAASDEVASARNGSPDSLARQTRGDLDAIVLRCLAKDPDDRYPGAPALAADLHAWRRGDAVQARQAPWTERTRRAVRKHWLPIGAAGLVFAATLAATIVSVTFWRRESDQRAIAEARSVEAQTTADLFRIVFDGAAPSAGGRADTTVLELLEYAAAWTESESAGLDPRRRVQLRTDIGEAFAAFGRADLAVAQLEPAYEEATAGDWMPAADRLSLAIECVRALRDAGRRDDAWALCERLADEMTDDTPLEARIRILNTRTGLAVVFRRNDLAYASAQEVRTLIDQYGGADGQMGTNNAINLAHAARTTGRPDEAEAAARRAIQIASKTDETWGPPLADQARHTLAIILASSGRPAEAEPLLMTCLRYARDTYGEASEHVEGVEMTLATVLRHLGRADEAIEMHQRIASNRVARYGENHQNSAASLYNTAGHLMMAQRYGEAQKYAERAHRAHIAVFGADHAETQRAFSVLQTINGRLILLDMLARWTDAASR